MPRRTLLAWIRTGLAMMGFGFVVARFGLFLQQLDLIQRASAPPSYGLSLWFGTALIALGCIANVLAGWHHSRLVQDLDRGSASHLRPSRQAEHAAHVTINANVARRFMGAFYACLGLWMARTGGGRRPTFVLHCNS